MKKYYTLDQLILILKEKGGKVILTHGIFDIIHKGHIILFSEAKKYGDYLVVGLDHDESAKILKGNNRPFNKFQARLSVLEHIEDVDYIFGIPSIKRVSNIFGLYSNEVSDIYSNIYRKLSPYAIATNVGGGKYGKYKKKQAEKLGIKFLNIPKTYRPNTTDILNTIYK